MSEMDCSVTEAEVGRVVAFLGAEAGSQPTEKTPCATDRFLLGRPRPKSSAGWAAGSQPTENQRVADPAADDDEDMVDHDFAARVDAQAEAAVRRAHVRHTWRIFEETINNVDIFLPSGTIA